MLFRLLTYARFGCAVQACALLMLCSGCKEEAPPGGDVSGKITVNGTSLKEGYITFEDPKRGIGASAEISNGEYAFSTPLDLGAYRVYVQPKTPSPAQMSASGSSMKEIPLKYTQVGSSPLEATVVEGPNTFDFNLEK